MRHSTNNNIKWNVVGTHITFVLNNTIITVAIIQHILHAAEKKNEINWHNHKQWTMHDKSENFNCFHFCIKFG